MVPSQQLQIISATLLDHQAGPETLRGALDEYVELCSQLGGIAPQRSFNAWSDDSLISNGVAINPNAAALCAQDYKRSIEFIRGVYAAINTAQRQFAGGTLEIIYAGCGPYATLLLPLLTQFEPQQLTVTLLDMHQNALDSVTKLITHFALDSYDINCICTDACQYQHPIPAHIIIAETMQKALEQEPQFMLTANLAPQLHQQGIFIPGCIHISASLQIQQSPGRTLDYELGNILTLSAETVGPLLARLSSENSSPENNSAIPCGLLSLPKFTEPKPAKLMLHTYIKIFDQNCLKDGEADISLPYHYYEIGSPRAGETYEVYYQLGHYPKFQFNPLGFSRR